MRYAGTGLTGWHRTGSFLSLWRSQSSRIRAVVSIAQMLQQMWRGSQRFSRFPCAARRSLCCDGSAGIAPPPWAAGSEGLGWRETFAHSEDRPAVPAPGRPASGYRHSGGTFRRDYSIVLRRRQLTPEQRRDIGTSGWQPTMKTRSPPRPRQRVPYSRPSHF